MWDSFVLGFVLGVLFLFVPGCFLFRGLGLSWPRAFSVAPLFSMALYPVLGILFDKIGISASWAAFFLIALAVGAAAFVAGAVVRRISAKGVSANGTVTEFSTSDKRRETLLLALYCGFGCIATFAIFVLNLDGADSFVQEFDNVYHLSTIQTFVETGNWSGITGSYYSNSDPSSINPLPSTGFYPAAWHCVVAMVSTCGGVAVPVALNSTNALFCAFVFSSGSYVLMERLFKDDIRIRIFGAFVIYGFVAFPWKLLAWGPIFPNYAALCLMPALMVAFIKGAEAGVPFRGRIQWFFVFAVGFVAVAFTQTNGLFVAVVFLAPFCVSQLYGWASAHGGGARFHFTQRSRIILCVAFCVLALGVWEIVYRLPFMRSLVTFNGWPAFCSVTQAVLNVLMLSFRETPAQLVLGVCVIAGAFALIKRRGNSWLVVSYALMGVMYVVAASTDGSLKHHLTGFWYADPMRLAANAALFAMPIASVGASLLSRALGAWLAGLVDEPSDRNLPGRIGHYVTAVLVVGLLFIPSFSIPGKFDVETGIGYSSATIESAYSASAKNILNPEERDFLEKVQDAIPSNSVVVNEPNDGSAFAYGLYGLNVYYRAMSGYDGDNETEASRLIRNGLNQHESDEGVDQALKSIGAEYLLQLDQGDFEQENRYIEFAYFPEQWEGIDSVNDSTPGFQLLLSEGDMRLYKIM